MISTEHIASLFLYTLPVSFRDHTRQFFKQYASSFRKRNDPVYNQHIELKKYHTERVCREISGLGSALGMNTGQVAFAEVIGWLHDIGRFEQFDRFGTFSDAESENHADAALRVVRNEGLLKDFEPEMFEAVTRSILNHNQPKVPENEPDHIDFYSRLLRDTDKLDIWRITIEMNIFHKLNTEIFPETYIVPSLLMNCFEEYRIITLDMVNSFYDSIVFRVSWIFDLNFSCTLKTISERNIIARLLKKLPVSDNLYKIKYLTDHYIQINT